MSQQSPADLRKALLVGVLAVSAAGIGSYLIDLNCRRRPTTATAAQGGTNNDNDEEGDGIAEVLKAKGRDVMRVARRYGSGIKKSLQSGLTSIRTALNDAGEQPQHLDDLLVVNAQLTEENARLEAENEKLEGENVRLKTTDNDPRGYRTKNSTKQIGTRRGMNKMQEEG